MTAVDDEVWSFLELVALHQGLAEEPDQRASLVAGSGFDHGLLVQLAMRHGLLAAVADFLLRHGYRRSLPVRLRGPVISFLHLSRHRAEVLSSEAVRVNAELATAGIPVAWTKGVVLQRSLYDGTGVRTYNDLDLMVRPADRQRTQDTLVRLGYAPESAYNPATGTLEPIARSLARLYQLSPDHLPHHHRLTGNPGVPVIALDVANSLTWHQSEWDVPVDRVLAAVVSQGFPGSGTLPTMPPVHTFLFLCLHLFREAWFQRTIQAKDVSLAQFADIERQWRRSDHPTRRAVAAAVHEFHLELPIAWVCAHTDRLLGSGTCAELGLADRASPAWLASARGPGGRELHWHGSMRERLRDTRPLRLVARS